jgi:hypothetical protein
MTRPAALELIITTHPTQLDLESAIIAWQNKWGEMRERWDKESSHPLGGADLLRYEDCWPEKA